MVHDVTLNDKVMVLHCLISSTQLTISYGQHSNYLLTLKALAKNESENVVCLSPLLHIFANIID